MSKICERHKATGSCALTISLQMKERRSLWFSRPKTQEEYLLPPKTRVTWPITCSKPWRTCKYFVTNVGHFLQRNIYMILSHTEVTVHAPSGTKQATAQKSACIKKQADNKQCFDCHSEDFFLNFFAQWLCDWKKSTPMVFLVLKHEEIKQELRSGEWPRSWLAILLWCGRAFLRSSCNAFRCFSMFFQGRLFSERNLHANCPR